MLKLVKVLWILIVCQCFYHSSAGKKIPLKVIPTILFLVIVIVVVLTSLFIHS